MLQRLLDHKTTVLIGWILLALALIIGCYFVIQPHQASYKTAKAVTMNIQETFSDDGTIDSDDSVSLAFQSPGIVESLPAVVGETVSQGQVLAVLDTSDLQAQLSGAQADVQSAEASLQSLENGATPQTVAVYSAAVSTAQASLSNAVDDAYIKAGNAILNQSDLLFNQGNSPNPVIAIPTDSSSIALSLNADRVAIGTRLAAWQSDIASSSSLSELAEESSDDLSFIKGFLDELTTETNRLTPGNSGLSQTQINAYVADVNGAESEISAVSTELDAAMNGLDSAEASKTQIQASSTIETIQEAEAGVAKAQANVQAIQAEIGDATIVAPFNGTIAGVDIKVGGSVTAGEAAIDMTSDSGYKVDVYAPENKVAEIKVGDTATITFDAYGQSVTATATVATIDSSPTDVSGASAYKVTLIFDGSSLDIRAGMTANTTILGETLPNVTAVPDSAVISAGSSPFVLVKNNKGSFIQTPVEIGDSAGGWTQIISGISPGQEIAAFGSARDQR